MESILKKMRTGGSLSENDYKSISDILIEMYQKNDLRLHFYFPLLEFEHLSYKAKRFFLRKVDWNSVKPLSSKSSCKTGTRANRVLPFRPNCILLRGLQLIKMGGDLLIDKKIGTSIIVSMISHLLDKYRSTSLVVNGVYKYAIPPYRTLKEETDAVDYIVYRLHNSNLDETNIFSISSGDDNDDNKEKFGNFLIPVKKKGTCQTCEKSIQ